MRVYGLLGGGVSLVTGFEVSRLGPFPVCPVCLLLVGLDVPSQLLLPPCLCRRGLWPSEAVSLIKQCLLHTAVVTRFVTAVEKWLKHRGKRHGAKQAKGQRKTHFPSTRDPSVGNILPRGEHGTLHRSSAEEMIESTEFRMSGFGRFIKKKANGIFWQMKLESPGRS